MRSGAPDAPSLEGQVNALTTSLRALGMEEQAEAIEQYHATVDEYVDGQQAVDPAELGSAMRDDGLWLTRLYDHAKRLLAAVKV